jgi:hypothetical protein
MQGINQVFEMAFEIRVFGFKSNFITKAQSIYECKFVLVDAHQD